MTQERRLSAKIHNLEKPKNSSTLFVVFAQRGRESAQDGKSALTACHFLYGCIWCGCECWERKRNRTPSAHPLSGK